MRDAAPKPARKSCPPGRFCSDRPSAAMTPPTSWLGGAPRAPKDFRWPLGDDGKPLHFIAQIDLSALAADPKTGAPAPGLPQDGALLVFFGDGYAIRLLGGEEVEQGAPTPPPITAPDISALGFWSRGRSFNAWAVDPVPYMSDGETHPDFIADPFEQPTDWITTWGLAALEAEMLVDALERELEHSRTFVQQRKERAAARLTPPPKHVEERLIHCGMIDEAFPPFLAELSRWRDRAKSMPPKGLIDVSALEAIFATRVSLSKKMEKNYGTRHLLPGDAASVWNKIVGDMPELARNQDFSDTPPALQHFVELKITGWRGHRLFGIEPEFPNNFEDLRLRNPILSIAADPLLGTQLEHH